MNETFYALVENGVVVNVMVLYPPNAAEFEGAARPGGGSLKRSARKGFCPLKESLGCSTGKKSCIMQISP